MCFFNRGDTEGTNSSKMLCFCFFFFFLNRGNTEGTNSSKICVRRLCIFYFIYVNLCQDCFCGYGEFVVWWLVWRVNRRRIEHCFSLDVILCGWLGSEYQPTNQHFRHTQQQRSCHQLRIISKNPMLCHVPVRSESPGAVCPSDGWLVPMTVFFSSSF